MPTKLSTTLSKIHTIPNAINASIIMEFHKYMKDNDSSDRHQNNALKVVIAYAKYLGSDESFHDVKHKEQITSFLDTKIKSLEQDPDKKVDQKNNVDIHIHIDKTFSLDEARNALNFQKDVHPRGKIVLAIENG